MKPDGEHCIRFSQQFAQEINSSTPATASIQNSESRLFRRTGQIAPGLGTAEVIDKITVRWPDGAQQIIQGPVAANQAMLITEE